jgi:hypothetical protein
VIRSRDLSLAACIRKGGFMVDELKLDALVRAFEGKGYSLLERIILSTDGTVQALLSVIWGPRSGCACWTSWSGRG